MAAAPPPAIQQSRLLGSPAPSPFSETTAIRFDQPSAGPVTVMLYDVPGRRIRKLLDDKVGPGEHVLNWDGRDDTGRAVQAGMYYCELRWEDGRSSRSVVRMR